jgi:hypothetical protein
LRERQTRRQHQASRQQSRFESHEKFLPDHAAVIGDDMRARRTSLFQRILEVESPSRTGEKRFDHATVKHGGVREEIGYFF